MKSMIVFISLLLSSLAFAKPLTPMGLIEKASYQIGGQVSQKKIDASFLTDILTVNLVRDANGIQIQMRSPSKDKAVENIFVVNFDKQGAMKGSDSSFHSVAPGSPFLKTTNAAIYLDKIAEAFVDHLNESPVYLEVAQKVVSIALVPNPQGLLAEINLEDSRVYHLQMNQKAQVVSRGF